MTSHRLPPVALLATFAVSCQPSATVRYNGKERAKIVSSGAAVRVIAGRAEAPEGHEVLGVITTQCTALDGSTGLMEAPCTEESMASLARERAAELGGTALFELVCGTDESDRFMSGATQPGSGAQSGQTQSQITNTTTIRTITTCRATVLRSEDATAPAPVATTTATPGEHVVVSGQQVAIEWSQPGPKLTPREAATVGEMDAFPEGYRRLGQVTGRCAKACAQSVVTRALKEAAAARGALALAELDCRLEGELWRCQALVVGPATAAPKPEGSGGAAPTDAPGGQAPDGSDGGAGGGGSP